MFWDIATRRAKCHTRPRTRFRRPTDGRRLLVSAADGRTGRSARFSLNASVMQARTLRRLLVAVVTLTQVPRALAAQDPAHVKTAAEVNKNIQVLKALPAPDLVPAMQFIAGSLGVDCSHCHVTTKTGAWPMESDDKPPKLVAQVLDRFLQAIGGPEANARITSRAYRGTIAAARDQPLPLEILEAAPDKLRATITRADGVAVQAVDGVPSSAPSRSTA
jgi:hypothetical protein